MLWITLHDEVGVTSVRDRPFAGVGERYEIERELGRGATAVVYRARDRKHDRLVAVKVLRPEVTLAIGVERFLREIRLLARLQHPHILPLYDSGEFAGALFYVMPFVEGESLRERIKREQRLPVEDALRLAREVADALDYAHEHNVVHRDVKPENILLQRGHAMVSDFGVARAIFRASGERTTESGVTVGTPAYMSPEQASGDPVIDGRADVYALGCVTYEMLTGSPPFTGPSAQVVIARRFTETPSKIRVVRPTVPESVDDAIRKALAAIPAERFARASEFARALTDTRAVFTGSVTARRRRLLLVGASALALVLVIGAVILARR
jgi:serine/threonine-protein kinase